MLDGKVPDVFPKERLGQYPVEQLLQIVTHDVRTLCRSAFQTGRYARDACASIQSQLTAFSNKTGRRQSGRHDAKGSGVRNTPAARCVERAHIAMISSTPGADTRDLRGQLHSYSCRHAPDEWFGDVAITPSPANGVGACDLFVQGERRASDP
jgi:hypothetical protein